MFRRGFKSWCEEVSVQVRKQLGLSPSSPLDPVKLASVLGYRLLTPNQLPSLRNDVCHRLLSEHSDCWSAVTIPSGKQPLIVYNPNHSLARRSSSLMHEIAHLMLGHKPARMFVNPNAGLAIRTHDKDQEEEANWLSGCLLLPRTALLQIARRRIPESEACSCYSVSKDLFKFRMNVTAVKLQLSRRKTNFL